MDDYQKPRLVGDSVCSTSIFEFAVIGVRKCQCPSIAKHTHRLVERYTVFQQIASSLLIIPFKFEHANYLKGSMLALFGTQQAPRSGIMPLRVRDEQRVKAHHGISSTPMRCV
jgi:hypothetical protein